MTMSKTIQHKLHQQHVTWQRNYEAWLGDTEEWKKELNSALVQMSEIETALRDSLDALASHENTIRENQQRIQDHEVVISKEVMAGESKTDEEWGNEHGHNAAQHDRVAETHVRIKNHHHAVIAEFSRLIKKYREAF